jgi:hypothetical protein
MHTHARTYSAGRWDQPLPTQEDGPGTLVLAFCAPGIANTPQTLAALAAAFPRSLLMGCSTAGEIHGAGVHDDSISLAVARFEHTQLRQAATHIDGAADSEAAGQRLAALLLAQAPSEPLRAVFVLSDGLQVNGTPLVDGLSRGLPHGVVITGGLAGDGPHFRRTWVLDGSAAVTGRVCAVALFGSRLQVGSGCCGGWDGFGPERRVTRSAGNVLYELDDKPALALYRNYLGDRAADLPGAALLFPLTVRREGSNALVRTVLAVDEAHQSLTFAGDVPQGGVARLMRASMDKLVGSAEAAGTRAGTGNAQAAQSLSIAVSCVGRRLVLGERTEEEVEMVLQAMPPGAVQVGFYSYGEIAPAHAGHSSELHNQTMTVTTLSEA